MGENATALEVAETVKLITEYIRIVEWDKYQHYKDRGPLWIKLYSKILQSVEWVTSDNDTRVLMVALLILAADSGNKIPHNAEYIRLRAHLKDTPNLEPLLTLGFVEVIDTQCPIKEAQITLAPPGEPASNELAACYQPASPEKRREETEQKNQEQGAVAPFAIPDWIPSLTWHDYEEMRKKIRKPMTDVARKLTVRALERLRASGHSPSAVLEQSIQNSWQGVFELKPGGQGGLSAAGARKQRIVENQRRAAEIIASSRGDAAFDATGDGAGGAGDVVRGLVALPDRAR